MLQIDCIAFHPFLKLNHEGLETTPAPMCRICFLKLYNLIFAKFDSHSRMKIISKGKVNFESDK